MPQRRAPSAKCMALRGQSRGAISHNVGYEKQKSGVLKCSGNVREPRPACPAQILSYKADLLLARRVPGAAILARWPGRGAPYCNAGNYPRDLSSRTRLNSDADDCPAWVDAIARNGVFARTIRQRKAARLHVTRRSDSGSRPVTGSRAIKRPGAARDDRWWEI